MSIEKHEFEKSMNPTFAMYGACLCNKKNGITIQNNMGESTVFLTCDICGTQWVITLEKIEEEENGKEKDD